jgi:trimeric autotransporter adhesin
MKKLTVLGLGIGIIGIMPTTLAAQEIFGYSYFFDSVTTSSGTTDPGVRPTSPGAVFGPFSAVGYEGNSSRAGMFDWANNELGGIDGDDDFSHFTGQLNPEKFFEVTLTPVESWSLNLETIDFGVVRSPTGIRSYAVRSSLDDFANNLPVRVFRNESVFGTAPDNSFQWLFDDVTKQYPLVGNRINLGAGFDALTSPVTFRFYGWNAEDSSGSFCIDNVTFSASIQMVPEAGTGVLLTLGIGLAWLTRGFRPKC